VQIPMRGTATSLNAAVATSIVLYEVDTHRRPA
jgi:tRNA G18 (ribose-2'-O)-methylase SpoU